MKKRIVWLGLVLGVATVVAAVPQGHHADRGWFGSGRAIGEHPGMERHHGDAIERLTVLLDLDEQQVEQWREAQEGRQALHKGLDEMRGVREEVREMLAEERPDAMAIGELVIEAHRGMEAARAQRDEFHAELMSILTPEQRERFELMQELRSDRPEGDPGRFRGGRTLGPRHNR